MSGITPLIDTLLHQVLGKRVDHPMATRLAAAVSALAAVQPEHPVQSDSRLDPRGVQQYGVAGRNDPGPQASFGAVRDIPRPSVSIELSAAAKLIAAVLASSPERPPAIQGKTPLAPSPELLDAGSMQSALRSGIASSGLFYESHLARWYRGEMSKGDLAREPQFQEGILRVPAGSPSALQASSPPGASSSQASRQGNEGGVVGESHDLDHAGLIVRKQLEVLAQPVLHWEGEVLPGVPAHITVHLSPAQWLPPLPNDRDQDEKPSAAPEGAGDWIVNLNLHLPLHGSVSLRVRAQDARLIAEVTTSSDALAKTLAERADDLKGRLLRGGFAGVAIVINGAR